MTCELSDQSNFPESADPAFLERRGFFLDTQCGYRIKMKVNVLLRVNL
jgi:hypothetical protein